MKATDPDKQRKLTQIGLLKGEEGALNGCEGERVADGLGEGEHVMVARLDVEHAEVLEGLHTARLKLVALRAVAKLVVLAAAPGVQRSLV